MVLFQIPGLVLQIKGVYCYLVRTYYLITKFLEPIKCLWTSNFKISKSKKHCITLYNFFQKSAKKNLIPCSLTYSLTWVSTVSTVWVTQLLILTGFHGLCYSRYSYSRVFTGHATHDTHTHGFSWAMRTHVLILTRFWVKPYSYSLILTHTSWVF
jgi:hypothetical protein